MITRRMNILVIQDEPIITMTLHSMLSRTDHHVIGPFAGVKQANAALDAEHVDLAVLDVRLGDADVFPLAATLSERKIPFGFVTGYGRQKLPQAFANRPCLSKPFRETEVLILIDELLKSQRRPNDAAVS